MAPPSVSDVMREALRASADNYVAALVEVVGQRECWGEGQGTLCADTVAVIQRFAARLPEGRDFPPKFRLVTGGSEKTSPARGSRYLVIATPLPGSGVYGARALFLDPTGSEVRSWKAQVEAALDASGGAPQVRGNPTGSRAELEKLFDSREWIVRNTLALDLGSPFKDSSAILLTSTRPRGQSGAGEPLDAVDVLIVDPDHRELYRYSKSRAADDVAKFRVDDVLESKDVTGDGIPELLFHTGSQGASDWWTKEHVIYRVPGSSDFRDIAPREFGQSWRQAFRWISFRGAALALVARPIEPEDSNDPHMCHSCPKFYQYLVFKWERGRKSFVLLRSIQSTKDFDSDTDPLTVDMEFIRQRLSQDCP